MLCKRGFQKSVYVGSSGGTFKEVNVILPKNTTLLQKSNSLIFALLNKRITILLQQVLAGFFLALFFFVHVVKVTHHHNLPAPAVKGISHGEKATASADCSVCAYQLAKDSCYLHSFPLLLTVKEHAVKYPLLDKLFVTSIGSGATGRGPPLFS